MPPEPFSLALSPTGCTPRPALIESFSIAMSTEKKGMFIAPDGANLVFTFVLVSSLFFLWAVCNGMIDVMDKHFQEELHHEIHEILI